MRVSQHYSRKCEKFGINYNYRSFILLDLTNLFALLEPRGVSKKLSESMGISTGNISDWKSGKSKPTAEALLKIADYFNVSIDYLLGRTNVKEVNK